ncbi:MAG: histidine kinase [Treponema sp.]|jgi:hypothetical protein|nr:histidine kinase [Treponema sp.]
MKAEARLRSFQGAPLVLRRRFTFFIVVSFFLPILAVVSLLFYRASAGLREDQLRLGAAMAEGISSELDALTSQVYAMSDRFFTDTDTELRAVLNGNYQNRPDLKYLNQFLTAARLRAADTFRTGVTIDAIYTSQGELFNFSANPGVPGSGDESRYRAIERECIDLLERLGADSPDKLARLHWFPLERNVFSSGDGEAGGIRQRRIVMGTRRTYHRFLGAYTAAHIFLFTEEEIYRRYAGYLYQSGETALILDEQGHLISASDPALLEEPGRAVPLITALASLTADDRAARRARGEYRLRVDGRELLVSAAASPHSRWYTVVVSPSDLVTASMTALFRSLVAAIAVIVISVSGGLLFFGRQISLREKRSRDLELRILMGQINPHFMYNTLETIVWKANQARLPEIGRLASQLGNLLRLSMSGGDLLTPVEQELRHARLYIDLQKTRYQEKLDFELAPVPPEILSRKTPRLIIQPCLENAINHGMRPGRPLLVRLAVEMDSGGALCFTIRDDGAGIERERLLALRGFLAGTKGAGALAGGGLGLKNIHERLALYFGPGYGVDIASGEGEGTAVTIRIPGVIEP